mgnify:CR=1 FL=1
MIRVHDHRRARRQVQRVELVKQPAHRAMLREEDLLRRLRGLRARGLLDGLRLRLALGLRAALLAPAAPPPKPAATNGNGSGGMGAAPPASKPVDVSDNKVPALPIGKSTGFDMSQDFKEPGNLAGDWTEEPHV